MAEVLIYGECGKFGSGAWCYSDALLRAGHKVSTFDPARSLGAWNLHPIWRLWRRVRSEMPGWLRRRHSDEFRAAVRLERPTHIVVLKGLWLASGDVMAARDEGAYVALVNHDDFFSSNRNNWSKVQREALHAYDRIYATRRVNVEELRGRGLRAEFFPFSYHPPIHHTVSPRTDGEARAFAADVVFVGTYEHDRALLLEHLAAQADVKIAIYGEQWWKLNPRSPLRSSVNHRFITGDELCFALGQAKCSLGFLRKENRDEYTQRSLEIPACGGVLVAERTPEHIRLFREGLDAEFFASTDFPELAAKVKMVSSSTERRETLRQNGACALTGLHFTYADRIRQLFADSTVDNADDPRNLCSRE